MNDPDVPFTCPHCGHPGEEFKNTCPACGRPFVRDYIDTQMNDLDDRNILRDIRAAGRTCYQQIGNNS